MRFPSFVLFPALLLSAASPGADLYKCVAPSGAVSYQSLPCAGNSRQAWVQPVKAEVAPAPRAQAGRVRAAGPPGRGRAAAATVRQAKPRQPGAAQKRRMRCEKARREADALRDRLWNKLDFRQRSDLDAKVARACGR
ncbi:DUF4124 domain-containing protein [Arenimonas sp.]|uniref:DUF4124 domain-containing protein n=1 Tax=Arenimonas sp. TaxID=1872635 RepID=UPI0035B11B87